jgi:hypothetical protein|tara:strand:- start:3101 stop:3790 length:690 start_codon:yes stop_codon:yes gene_type:complete
MATSGTSDFTLDIIDICEEAYERAGLEMRGGYDLKTARRSLDLMSLEWINRGLNLWTIEEGTQTLTAGTATYSFPAGTIDFLEHHIRTDAGNTDTQADTSLVRVSPSTFQNIPNKLTSGKPLQIYIQRTTSPQYTLWPVPDDAQTYTVVFLRIKRIQDVGTAGSNTYDAPDRWLPALTSGLAYYVAMKRPESSDRLGLLKQVYEEQFALCAAEDRVKAGVQLIPGGYTY